MLQSLIWFGAIVGFFIMPYIADNYGRKFTETILNKTSYVRRRHQFVIRLDGIW